MGRGRPDLGYEEVSKGGGRDRRGNDPMTPEGQPQVEEKY